MEMHLQISLDLILFSVLYLGTIAENQDRMKYGRVSQHASVYRERAVHSRRRVSATSFDVEASTSHGYVSQTSQGRMFQTSTFRGHVSPTDPPTYEAPKAQQEEPAAIVHPIPNSFLRGPYDTSLLPLYVEHVTRHVWEGNVHLFTFTLHLSHTN